MTLQRFSLADLDRVYYAEACEPIAAASKKGTIQIQALARDYYHGKPIRGRLPRGVLRGERPVD